MFKNITTLLAGYNISEAVPLIEELYSGPDEVNAEFTHWLLNEALGWSVKGLIAEQRNLYEVILTNQPDNYEAWHFLGFNSQLAGQYKKSEDCYSKALSLNPGYVFAKLAHAQIRMMLSCFKEGRDTYEARFDARTEASGPDWRGLPITRWQGESVTGKHMYIWAEQGLGDIVMFAGFLPFIMAQSPKRLVLGVFPKLVTLFKRSFPDIVIESIDDAANHALSPAMHTAFPQIEKLAEQVSVPFSLEPLRAAYNYSQQYGVFDIAAPMGDLLVYCLPEFLPVKKRSSYLVPDPERVLLMQKKLKSLGEGRYIGISWYTQNARESTRNIPLEQWLPLLTVPRCHFISLQHFVSHHEIEKFCMENNCKITSFAECDLSQNAEDLAALIAAVDEVVTIDNSNAHLAGALNIKTSLLLSKGCNYRWPEYEDDKTIWYKSVTTIRQEILFEWKPVIAQVILKLEQNKK